MTTHEEKLDVPFWEDVQSGKQNFIIMKKDGDFQIGDILELKAYENGQYRCDVGAPHGSPWAPCEKDRADTITARIDSIITAPEWNIRSDKPMTTSRNIRRKTKFNDDDLINIETLLKDYFKVDYLPENYVVMRIEVENE